MGIFALINHTLNFLAPALWLALWLPLCARFFMKNSACAMPISQQIAILFVAGSGVLVASLMVFGRDGKMLTYLALVLVAASAQWLLSRR